MKPQKIYNFIKRVLKLFSAMLLYDADLKVAHIIVDAYSLYQLHVISFLFSLVLVHWFNDFQDGFFQRFKFICCEK